VQRHEWPEAIPLHPAADPSPWASGPQSKATAVAHRNRPGCSPAAVSKNCSLPVAAGDPVGCTRGRGRCAGQPAAQAGRRGEQQRRTKPTKTKRSRFEPVIEGRQTIPGLLALLPLEQSSWVHMQVENPLSMKIPGDGKQSGGVAGDLRNRPEIAAACQGF